MMTRGKQGEFNDGNHVRIEVATHTKVEGA
jgi:hypothetical protein